MLYNTMAERKHRFNLRLSNVYERSGQVKDEVIGNRHLYEYHSEIVDKAMKDMNNDECDIFDKVAPNAEQFNQQVCTVSDKP